MELFADVEFIFEMELHSCFFIRRLLVHSISRVIALLNVTVLRKLRFGCNFSVANYASPTAASTSSIISSRFGTIARRLPAVESAKSRCAI